MTMKHSVLTGGGVGVWGSGGGGGGVWGLGGGGGGVWRFF